MEKEDIIYFNRKSRRGAIVFLFIFIFIAIIPRAYSLFLPEPSRIVESKSEQSKAVEVEEEKQDNFNKQKFNPNHLTVEDWTNYGFTEKQAESIINFKNKIGGFQDSDDLKKSYVIDEKKFEKLQPLLDFTSGEESITNVEKNETINPKDSNLNIVDEDSEDNMLESDSLIEDRQIGNLTTIELNSASFEELISVSGIGEYFAEKIIDERIKRGGFTELEQLLDIYYFDEENLDQIKDYVKVDADKIEKFDLNFTTMKRMSRHPEITWEMARSIGDLRDELGRFSSIDQLLLSGHIDMRRYNKIKHYFKISE